MPPHLLNLLTQHPHPTLLCILPPFTTSTALAPKPQLSGKHLFAYCLTLLLIHNRSSSGVAGSTGFATGTAVPIPTGSGAVGSGAAGSGPGATGSPISPSAPIDSGNAGGAPFTGAASKTVGSLAAAALAFVGLALTL